MKLKIQNVVAQNKPLKPSMLKLPPLNAEGDSHGQCDVKKMKENNTPTRFGKAEVLPKVYEALLL